MSHDTVTTITAGIADAHEVPEWVEKLVGLGFVVTTEAVTQGTKIVFRGSEKHVL